MNFIKLINSCEVTYYLQKTGYQLTPVQKAFVIFRSEQIDLNKKIDYYQQLLNEEDTEINVPDLSIKTNSLHQFLEKFILIQKKLIERFYMEESEVELHFQEPCYSSNLRRRRDVHKGDVKQFIHDVFHQDLSNSPMILFKIKRDPTYGKMALSMINSNLRVSLTADPCFFDNEDDYTLYNAINEFGFGIPVPFKRGDCLRNQSQIYPYIIRTVVYDGLSGKDIETIDRHNLDSEDTRRGYPLHTACHGYSMLENGTVCCGYAGDLLDMDYSSLDRFSSGNDSLHLIRDALLNKIDLCLLLNLFRNGSECRKVKWPESEPYDILDDSFGYMYPMYKDEATDGDERWHDNYYD